MLHLFMDSAAGVEEQEDDAEIEQWNRDRSELETNKAKKDSVVIMRQAIDHERYNVLKVVD